MAIQGVTLITPTHDRPQLFKLTERWLARCLDHYTGEVQWIVADDGNNPAECTLGQEHILADTHGITGVTSFLDNMRRGLEAAAHDYIFIIEDDDWRCREYISNMMQLFSSKDIQIVGEAGAKYYHIPTLSYYIHANYLHSSWTQTGFRADLLDEVLKCVALCNSYLLDSLVWRKVSNDKNTKVKRTTDWCIGIKGLSRAAALGAGHTKRMYRLQDPQGQILTQWIGAQDREVYFDIIRNKSIPLSSIVAEPGRRRSKKSRWSK